MGTLWVRYYNAFPQNYLGKFFSCNIHQVISNINMFLLTLTPFCWGVYGTVNWWWMQTLLQNRSNASEVYSLKYGHQILKGRLLSPWILVVAGRDEDNYRVFCTTNLLHFFSFEKQFAPPPMDLEEIFFLSFSLWKCLRHHHL